jgi:hypothetical protein
MSCIDLLGRTWSPPAGPAAPAASPPDQAKAPAPHLPDPPPLTGAPLTVDDAWQIFGVAQKRAPRADVKRRYLAFAAKWHPDKHPDDQVTATAQLVRANAAYALLAKHCRWQ